MSTLASQAAADHSPTVGGLLDVSSLADLDAAADSVLGLALQRLLDTQDAAPVAGFQSRI